MWVQFLAAAAIGGWFLAALWWRQAREWRRVAKGWEKAHGYAWRGWVDCHNTLHAIVWPGFLLDPKKSEKARA